MKLCINCKHYRKDIISNRHNYSNLALERELCAKSEKTEIDPVDGKLIICKAALPCIEYRYRWFGCGLRAKYYTERTNT